MSRKYPFVKQEALKDCGAACLSMIIKYHKGYVDLETLRDITKTNRNGANAYNLIEAAMELGFEARGVRLSNIESEELIVPCIAHVTIDQTYKHYVVIYKIDLKKRTVIIADPSREIKTISIDDFNKIWNNVILILYPIKNLPINKEHSIIKFTLDLLLMHKKILINLLLLSLFITGFTVASSFFLQWILGSIGIIDAKMHIMWTFTIFSIIYLLKIISDFMRNKLLIYINQKIDYILTMDTFKNIMSLPYNYYRNRTTGEILARINDLGIVRNVISKLSLTIFIDTIVILVALIFLYLINSTLFVLAGLIFILYVLILYIFKNSFNKYINRIQEKKAIVSSYLVESINGFETIKGLNIADIFIKKFKQKYTSLLNEVFKLDNLYNYQYLFKEIIGNMGFIIIITVGTLLVIDNKMSIGALLTFNALLSYFLSPIRSLIDLDMDLKESENALRRILDLNIKKIDTGIIDQRISGAIKINNLNYSYDNINNLLNNINFNIKQGEKVIITGSSGSGKSTIFKLLMKYYKVNRNMIEIDAIDINDYNDNSINQAITCIAQNEILFTDTLINNIKLNREVSNNKFLEITKICHLKSIIKDNSLGYNLLIEENGFNISGGEGERIILARSLIKDSAIILIDEGLSQVDTNLERQILKDLFKYYKQKTIIMISHRIDNIDLFNHLIEIEQGSLKKDVMI